MSHPSVGHLLYYIVPTTQALASQEDRDHLEVCRLWQRKNGWYSPGKQPINHKTHLENLRSIEGAVMELGTFENPPCGVAVWIGRGTSGVVVVTHPG